MPTPQPLEIGSAPGIKRDTTLFEGEHHVDGQWCRWNARAKPTKIGGYSAVTQTLTEKVYGMGAYVLDTTNNLYMGSQSLFTQVQTDLNGVLSNQFSRTPAGLVADPNYLWQIKFFYNKVGGSVSVIAHPGANLADIANTTGTHIYYGALSASTALNVSAMSPVSGGIQPVPPYLFAFGSNGQVNISPLNDPTIIEANSVFVTSQKVVAGLPLRNSAAPAVILWSLDQLVTGVFNASLTATAGGIPTFDFNEVGGISVLSSQGIVEYDSIYYWPGVDRFYMFNGIIRELPNQLNLDFFFDNINFTWRQKAFTFKVPRWGEIWFCAPLGKATECNHAIIYNVRLNTWYDTPLPDGGRTAAVFASVFPRPFMCDPDLATGSGYTLWQHEVGVDKVVGSSVLPILSYYQTHEISPIYMQPKAVDKAYRVAIVEPDFKQVGDMVCQVFRRPNARSAQVASTAVSFPDTATGAATEVCRYKDNARLLSFKFSSNVPGGNFTAGRIVGHIDITDGRIT